MQTSSVEGLVAVDISEAGHRLLIHQQGFDLTRTIDQLSETGRSKFERLRTKLAQPPANMLTAVRKTPDATEASRVAEAKLPFRTLDGNPQVRVFLDRLGPVAHYQSPGHAQGKHELSICSKLDDHALGTASSALDPSPRQQRT
jgi:hypothetical protein